MALFAIRAGPARHAGWEDQGREVGEEWEVPGRSGLSARGDLVRCGVDCRRGPERSGWVRLVDTGWEGAVRPVGVVGTGGAGSGAAWSVGAGWGGM